MRARLARLLRALAGWPTRPAALRLRVRALRHQNALVAALLGIGILLMIVHWSGGYLAGRVRPPPRVSSDEVRGPAPAPAPRPPRAELRHADADALMLPREPAPAGSW